MKEDRRIKPVKWIVDAESGCWNWQLNLDHGGYGLVKVDTRTRLAHRWSYELTHGSIPEGMTVDHLCFNPPCVNPAHMRLLSHAENAANQRKAHKTECCNGHAYDETNTYIRTNGRRDCRACTRDRQRLYRLRKAALNLREGA